MNESQMLVILGILTGGLAALYYSEVKRENQAEPTQQNYNNTPYYFDPFAQEIIYF